MFGVQFAASVVMQISVGTRNASKAVGRIYGRDVFAA